MNFQSIRTYFDSIPNNELVILGIILAAGLSLWEIYHVNKPKLTYIVNITQLHFPKAIENIKKYFQLQYKEKQIKNLTVAKVIISNEGKVTAENFSSPIQIISQNAPILYATLDENSTLDASKVNLNTKNNSIEITIDYLNENDQLVVNLAFDTQKNPNIIVKARCRGCSFIQPVQAPKNVRNKHFLLISFLICFSIFSTIVSIHYKNTIFSLEDETKDLQKELIEQQLKMYKIHSLNEKNMHEMTNNIKTYGDAIEAYIICKDKLAIYEQATKKKTKDIRKELIGQKLKRYEIHRKIRSLNEKNMHEITNNIKTYEDAIGAYISCEDKLTTYIQEAKEKMKETIKNLRKRNKKLYPQSPR